MRLIGVVDLMDGRAVHARGGRRDRYAPVGERGDPVALAWGYLERFGLTEIYVADLDAIVDGAPQAALVATLTALGAPVWLDAAVANVEDARGAMALGAARVIVGLETLPSFEALSRICDAVGRPRVAFSLDLRDGVPVASGEMVAGDTAERLAARAARAGAGAIILLDLARVGSGRGVDLSLLARVRDAVPGTALIAGGGIRTIADLDRLAHAGCDGALIATALHEGTLSAADLAPYLARA